MAVQTQIQTRRGTAATWTSTNPTLAAGEIGFETDTGKFKIGTGSASWTSLAYAGGTTAVTYLFNATSGQTTFSGADANSLTLAYTVGAEQVYLNGVLLVRGTDYTATNGTSIVLASGAVASDVLNVIAYSTMTLTDAYTQAQANATFPLNSIDKSSGKNRIINGDFGIWQRGTTFTSPNAGTYTADRFQYAYDGNGTATISRQTFTPGTAPVAGYEGQYFLRHLVTAAGTTTFAQIFQPIEDVRTFAGQTVTFSFWAKADSARSSFIYAEQNFGSGGSSTVQYLSMGSASLTTSWQRFSFTVALGSMAGKTIGTSSYLNFYIRGGVTLNASTDIWGVQVEAGSVATAFQTATGTIQGELAACQRYYWRLTGASAGYYRLVDSAVANSTTDCTLSMANPVVMRVTPTSVDYAGVYLENYVGAGSKAATSITIKDVSNPQIASANVTVASGLTAGTRYFGFLNNNTSSYLGYSAEL